MTADAEYPTGTHEIEFIGGPQCGNILTRSQFFEQVLLPNSYHNNKLKYVARRRDNGDLARSKLGNILYDFGGWPESK